MANGVSAFDYRMLFDEIAGQRHSYQDTISKSATNSVETLPTGQFRGAWNEEDYTSYFTTLLPNLFSVIH